MRASTFIYRHLIPLVQMQLLRRSATFVHASAVQRVGDQGVLLSGWGGSGKTSASSALYWTKPQTWRFMSDDFAIIDADGNLHFCPLPLNVFPYNTEAFDQLHDHVSSSMTRLERFHWTLYGKLFGKGAVARRLPPPIRFAGAGSCRIALSVHLQRGTLAEPAVAECSAADISRVCKNILNYELRQGLAVYAAAGAFCLDPLSALMSADEMAGDAARVVTQALARSRTLVATVPADYGPHALAGFVENLWGSSFEGSPVT